MPTPQSYTPVTTPYFSHLLIDSGMPISTADFYWIYTAKFKVPYLEYNKNLVWQKYRDVRGIEDSIDTLPCWSIAKLVGMLPEVIELNSNFYDEVYDTESCLKIKCQLCMSKSYIGYQRIDSEHDAHDYEFYAYGDFNKCVVRAVEWLLNKHLIQTVAEFNGETDWEEEF